MLNTILAMENKLPNLDNGIELHEGGGMTLTGDGITTFRNLTLYNGLALEASTGMKMSRGISALQVAKRDFKMKGTTITVFHQLGLKFIEFGYIKAGDHRKNLDKLRKYGKITDEQLSKMVKDLGDA